jgi:hemolysin activation/secretion protein
MFVLRHTAVLVLTLSMLSPVHAQQVVRPEVNPGLVQKRIPLPEPRQEAPAPLTMPEPPAAQTTASELHFVLSGVVIEGNTVFDNAALAPAYEDDLAQDIDFDAITRILDRITARYRAAGYFLSRAVAPPQSLERGILRIKVIEGYVERVTFSGADTRSERLLPYFAAVTQSRPLRLATLERTILLVNDLPGLHVAPVLTPIDEDAGRYALTLALDYRPLAGFASLDNRGPKSLGPWETQVSASAQSLLDDFDRALLSVFTTPAEPRELLSGELRYEHPLGSAGTRMALSAARSDLRPEGMLAPHDLKGTALRYVAQLTHPLIRSRAQSLWLSGTFDVLDSREHEQGAPLFNDRLRVLRAALDYAGSDDLGGVTALYGEASQGLTLLGASRADSALLSRSNGHADFTKFAATATREQALGGAWSVLLGLAGQKANAPLLVSEQFPLGGARFGRAYDPAEIAGDDGIAGSLEVRFGRAPLQPWLRSYQIYGFYDLGAVWNMGVSDATRRQSLASAGGGFRFFLPRDLVAALEIARPLTRIVAAEGNKPVRVLVNLSASF